MVGRVAPLGAPTAARSLPVKAHRAEAALQRPGGRARTVGGSGDRPRPENDSESLTRDTGDFVTHSDEVNRR